MGSIGPNMVTPKPHGREHVRTCATPVPPRNPNNTEHTPIGVFSCSVRRQVRTRQTTLDRGDGPWAYADYRLLERLPAARSFVATAVPVFLASLGRRERVAPSPTSINKPKGHGLPRERDCGHGMQGGAPLGSSWPFCMRGAPARSFASVRFANRVRTPPLSFAGSQGGSQLLRPVHGFRDDGGMSGCPFSVREIHCLHAWPRFDVTSALGSFAPARRKPLGEKIVY
jgi:hypothetical protein